MNRFWEILNGTSSIGATLSPENVILSLVLAFVLGHALANGLSERFFNIVPDNEDDLIEAGVQCVIYGVVDDKFTRRANGIHLFESAISTSNACCENGNSFVHSLIPYPVYLAARPHSDSHFNEIATLKYIKPSPRKQIQISHPTSVISFMRYGTFSCPTSLIHSGFS